MTSMRLVFSKCGNPMSELALGDEPVPTSIKPGEAIVKTLLSPINPGDILTIQGQSALKPQLPAIAGSEGVVEVVKGTVFKRGERAIVTKIGWGMWRQQGVIDENYLIKLPRELPLEAAATLTSNPCTAYILINSIVALQPGDVIIQNGANSAFGQAVIQLAKLAGFRTINVVRTRPYLQETSDMLKALGADVVITDVDLKRGLAALNINLSAPKLALECVGGPMAADLAATLCNGATMVIHGMQSYQPAQINQSDLIFREIRIVGFWYAKWIENHHPEEFNKIVEDLVKLYLNGSLKVPKMRKFPLGQWRDAVKRAMQGYLNEKTLLQFN